MNSFMHTTLPRSFYTDPEFYKRELDRFYFNRWICAGRADQIPNAGDYFTRAAMPTWRVGDFNMSSVSKAS